MCSRKLICYFAIGLLIMGIFMDEVDARRKILRGRKTITRRYYWGTAIPAWSIVLLIGISMLLAGGGLYAILQKFVVDNAEVGERHSYQPALQNEA
ncbi:hoka [Colletes latitarsis]|uniref:hoka n=1 Tax=Colletes latitarsis TaxID=2605962 RepID=UPI00403675E0